jgi:type I restriction enzyme S subunit
VGLSLHDGMITGAYTVFESLGRGSSEYFELFYRAMDDRKLLSPLYSGLRNTIPVERFLGTKTPQPPPAEQAAIVRFLDWTNGRLERAIRAKRKVIALLNEQKQAIIHRAVTRGLDPSVPLKPSGIPWLGDIPQHWEVRRLKSLCRVVTSGSRGWARYYADAGFVFLRIGNISTTSVDLRLKRITYVTPPAGAEGERTRARPDDLLLSITAQIGAVGVVPDGLGEAFVNQHTALIRLQPSKSFARWVAYGLLSQFGKDQCRLMTNGGTKIGLTLDDVRCLSVLLPPLEEQSRLVAGIENQTRELNVVISRLEREIELLREYRTRLVADVVTGKFDVREAAARLPDKAEEPEPLDETDSLADIDDAAEVDLDAGFKEADA